MFAIFGENGLIAHAVEQAPLARGLVFLLQVSVAVDRRLRRRVAHFGVVHRTAHRQELVARQTGVLHFDVSLEIMGEVSSPISLVVDTNIL
jgi:hypothetical protein